MPRLWTCHTCHMSSVGTQRRGIIQPVRRLSAAHCQLGAAGSSNQLVGEGYLDMMNPMGGYKL